MRYQIQEFIYDVIVSEGNLELQHIQQDIIFHNAYNHIIEEMQKEYWREHWYKDGCSLKSFISEQEEESIRIWLDYNKDTGVTLKHELN